MPESARTTQITTIGQRQQRFKCPKQPEQPELPQWANLISQAVESKPQNMRVMSINNSVNMQFYQINNPLLTEINAFKYNVVSSLPYMINS